MEVVPFQEQLDPAVRLGEGRSRTSEPSAELFELQILLPGQGPMRDLVRAASLEQAVEFAKNRYPNCRVTVPPQAAKKPKLARSHTSPSVAATARRKKLEAKSGKRSG